MLTLRPSIGAAAGHMLRLDARTIAEVQRRTAQAVGEGRDCIVTAETGSGKTLAFLMPALARLAYPDGVDDETQARACMPLFTCASAHMGGDVY